MPADDRDAKFERALEQQLRAGSLAEACPDEETLAAYHERSLSLEEMAHWKQHIAGCAQCQEALSLVEAAEKQLAGEWEREPIPGLVTAEKRIDSQTRAAVADTAAPIEMTLPAAKAPGPRPALMRWAVPLGAVAAGVLIWIGIHEQRLLEHSPASSSIQVAENRRQDASLPSQDAVPPKAAPPVARDMEEAVGNGRGRAPAPEKKDTAGVRPAAPVIAGDLLKDRVFEKKQAALEPPPVVAGNIAASSSPPPTKVPKPGPPDVLTETVEPSVQTAGQPVELPAGGVARGVQDQKYSGAMSKARSAPQLQAAPQEQAADINTNAMMHSQGLNRAIVQASSLHSGVIVTPDHNVWWKIGTNGGVQVTTNAGKNWKTLATGVTVQLTSGTAPSSKVCWIAGQAGALVLTTDRGRHWTSLTTPISGDLGGVHAVDAKHATIWDVTNRLSYETSDGGATWKQVANE